MAHVLITHRVADYAVWKRAFDDAATLRREAGERFYQVLRDDTDANLVVHFSRWTSNEAARRFFESDQGAQIRAQAGVEAPTFTYLEELDAGNL